MIIDKSCIRYF